MATQRVDFYVLPGTEERARLKLACRIAEQAYLAGQRVFVWLDEPASCERFDELLWTFADRSFVPHELYATRSSGRTPRCCSAAPRSRSSPTMCC
jgi:DNA polymerase IIIc chi subunit